MASVQGDKGVTTFEQIKDLPGFMLHAEIQGKQVLVPVSGLTEGLGDKFAPLLGQGWPSLGSFAFGKDSETLYNPTNPPLMEELTDPILFDADTEVEGEPGGFVGLSQLIIDTTKATATIILNGTRYELPTEPGEGAVGPYVGAYVFPKIMDPVPGDPAQLAPQVGFKFMDDSEGNKLFVITEVKELDFGWLVWVGLTMDFGELGPVFPFYKDDFPGIILYINDSSYDTTAYAFGVESQALAHSAYAFGYKAKATGEDAIAMGYGSTARGLGSFAVGASSYAEDENAIAMGVTAHATGSSSVAIGYRAYASQSCSVAIGEGTSSTTQHACTALGRYNADIPGYVLLVGWGASDNQRNNVFKITTGGKPDSAQIPSVNGGDLVVLGIVPPAAKPAFAGQIYLDANNKKLYVAKAATATTDWVAIN